MKTIIAIPLTMVLAYLLHLILPFWATFVAGFLIAFMLKKGYQVIFATFVGGALLWALLALKSGMDNGEVFSNKLGVLMQFSAVGVYLLTGAIGGVLAMFGGLTGWSILRFIFQPRRRF